MRDVPIDVNKESVSYNKNNRKWKKILIIINMMTLWRTSN